MEGSNSAPSPLSEERLLALLAPDGPIGMHLVGFEIRPQQREMLRAILRGYNTSSLALVEAGTGTGKSMAYLLPALLWAMQNKEPTVISTNTIALQEQLIHKDIPFLTSALQIECKAVLVKGMSNYLCLRKLEDSRYELPLYQGNTVEELQRIEAWASTTNEGSRSSLPFAPQPQTWERVCADSDACSREQCVHFKKCFFFKARRQAAEAHLLIANHHMLFTDLAQRAENDNYKNTAVLPPYRHVILDEAHNVEEIATHYLAERTHGMEIHRLFNLLATGEHSLRPHGKLFLLKSTIESLYRKDLPLDVQQLIQLIQLELIGTKAPLIERFVEVFNSLHAFTIAYQNPISQDQEENAGSCALRLLPHHLASEQWQEGILPLLAATMADAKRYLHSLASIERIIEDIDQERLREKTKNLCIDLKAIRCRLEKACQTLTHFIQSPLEPQLVRWIEVHRLKIGYNIHVVEAALDIAPLLVERFFCRFATIALCSATLATNRQFDFCRRRLGITETLLPGRSANEYIFDSPFDFAKQCLLVVPQDLPLPSHDTFIAAACTSILTAIEASQGNAFVLFTSYSMLLTCYEKLATQLQQGRYHPCKQGDAPRHALLKQFRSTNRSVLFGTDSFWEGVDVAGEALRCVIIVKLPFKVPSEPIVEARAAAIIARGGNPFIEMSLPQAIVKFKQGFGRLIRQQRDRGCIVCLDSRLITKSYGQQFINSLPPCPVAVVSAADMGATMQQFYRRTYYLTQN
jgi:ATP-dependent DNA helicase DinG